MNLGITTDSKYLIGDSNDSSKWKQFKIPLPKPYHKWHIEKYHYEYDFYYITLKDTV